VPLRARGLSGIPFHIPYFRLDIIEGLRFPLVSDTPHCAWGECVTFRILWHFEHYLAPSDGGLPRHPSHRYATPHTLEVPHDFSPVRMRFLLQHHLPENTSLRKDPHATRRSRDYLTPQAVDALIAAVRRLGRHGHWDATVLLLASRDGLRVSELVAWRGEQVDLESGVLRVIPHTCQPPEPHSAAVNRSSREGVMP
jgi:hypothetical protein